MTAGPSAVVGMIGGGQLSRMTQQAAIGLGIELHVLTPEVDAPAVVAGATPHLGDHRDADAVLRFADHCDVITLDHELTPDEILRSVIADGHIVRPHPDAGRFAQDKGAARAAFGEAGLPVPPFMVLDRGDSDAVDAFAENHGWPVVLKAPTGGYDGRGVEILDDRAALEQSDLARESPTWLIEALVPIAMELAVLVARRPSGEVRVYPVVETVQRDGICHELIAPARIDPELCDDAIELGRRIAESIGAIGILAIEMFLTDRGELVINEIATRPHNSGHITIEAAATSQFENHLRAVLDWPLGDTHLVTPAAATVNLLGPTTPADPPLDIASALELPDAHVHLYRKSIRSGRKIGHVTARAASVDEAVETARRCADRLLRR